MKKLTPLLLLSLVCACGQPQGGSDGLNGQDGQNGQDGSSCSVVDNADGSADMVCEDGTSTQVRGTGDIVAFEEFVAGDVVLNTLAEVRIFSEANVKVITGDLIFNVYLTRHRNDSLEVVGGGIYILGGADSVSFEALDSASAIHLEGVRSLSRLGNGSLQTDSFFARNSGDGSRLSGLNTTRHLRLESSNFSFRSMIVDTLVIENAETLSLDNLHIQGHLELRHIDVLESLPSFATRLSSIVIDSVGVEELRFDGLVELDKLMIFESGTNVDLNGLQSIGDLVLGERARLILSGVENLVNIDEFDVYNLDAFELVGQFAALQELHDVYFQDVDFTSELPAFEQLQIVESLFIDDSSFDGGVEKHFGSLMHLGDLNIYESLDQEVIMPLLQSADSIEVDESESLELVSFPLLTQVEDFEVEYLDNLSTLILSSSIEGEVVEISHNPLLSECGLAAQFNNFDSINIEENALCFE